MGRLAGADRLACGGGRPSWIADRMAVLVGDSRCSGGNAAVPDAARRRPRLAVLDAVDDALWPAAQPRLDRRGDRRGGAGLLRRDLSARRADRGYVPPYIGSAACRGRGG